MFRAAGPKSCGTNVGSGIKAGRFTSFSPSDIPTFDYVDDFWSLEEIENETFSHSYKTNRTPTGWISTTSSLLRALQILLIEHRAGGELFVIDRAACGDIFCATDLWACLPGLKNTRESKELSSGEYLVWGKVDANAILGSITAERLLRYDLATQLQVIAPGLSDVRAWCQKKDWALQFKRNYPDHRSRTDGLRDAANKLAHACSSDLKTVELMMEKFLGPDFRINAHDQSFMGDDF